VYIESSSPIAVSDDTMQEPPYEKNGSGSPVIGIIPITMPMFVTP